MKDSRRIGGLKAKRFGQAFENVLQAHLNGAVISGLVSWWDHSQASFKCLSKKRFVPIKAGCADFIGQLSGGLSFAMEAKSTDQERFYRSAILDDQAKQLDAAAKGGGLALLAVQFRVPLETNSRYMTWGSFPSFVVPWQSVPWKAARSALSVTLDDLRGWEIETPIFLARFGAQCPTCRQVKSIRRAGAEVFSFCLCGVSVTVNSVIK